MDEPNGEPPLSWGSALELKSGISVGNISEGSGVHGHMENTSFMAKKCTVNITKGNYHDKEDSGSASGILVDRQPVKLIKRKHVYTGRLNEPQGAFRKT